MKLTPNKIQSLEDAAPELYEALKATLSLLNEVTTEREIKIKRQAIRALKHARGLDMRLQWRDENMRLTAYPHLWRALSSMVQAYNPELTSKRKTLTQYDVAKRALQVLATFPAPLGDA